VASESEGMDLRPGQLGSDRRFGLQIKPKFSSLLSG